MIDSLKKEIAYQKLCALLQLKICIYSNNPYGIPASVYDVSFKNEDEKKSFILKYKEIIKRYSNEKKDMNRIFGNNCIIDVNLYDNQQDKEFPRIAMTDFDRELLQIYATFYSIIKYYVAIRYNPQIELKEIEECAERDYISTAILMEFKKAALYLRNRQMLMVYNAVSNNEILEKPMLELKDGCGYNALHYSIISNNLELTKTLLHRMKVNESIMEENSIIERCKLYGNVMLFAKRRDFLDSIINSSKEFTPLFEMERSLKRMKGMNVALGITKACAEKMLENANEQMLQAGSYSDEGYEDYDEYEDYDNYEEYDDYEEPCSEEDELREIEDLQEKEYSEDMNENYERDYYEIAQSLYEDFKSSKFTSRLSLLDPDAKNDELDAQLDELYDVRIGLRAFLKERYESGYDELKQCEHLYVKILQNVYSDSEKLLSYLKTDYDNLKLIEIEGNEILVKEN